MPACLSSLALHPKPLQIEAFWVWAAWVNCWCLWSRKSPAGSNLSTHTLCVYPCPPIPGTEFHAVWPMGWWDVSHNDTAEVSKSHLHCRMFPSLSYAICPPLRCCSDVSHGLLCRQVRIIMPRISLSAGSETEVSRIPCSPLLHLDLTRHVQFFTHYLQSCWYLSVKYISTMSLK